MDIIASKAKPKIKTAISPISSVVRSKVNTNNKYLNCKRAQTRPNKMEWKKPKGLNQKNLISMSSDTENNSDSCNITLNSVSNSDANDANSHKNDGLTNINNNKKNVNVKTATIPITPKQKQQNHNKHSPALRSTGSPLTTSSPLSSSNVDTLASAANAAVNKMRKAITPCKNKNQKKVQVTSSSATPNASTDLTVAVPSTTTELATTTSNGSNNYGGSAVAVNNHKSKKHFQVPADVLDDLATRFIINFPDIELSNLIRICFQIELAHWFYLDFFCDGGGVVQTATNALCSSDSTGTVVEASSALTALPTESAVVEPAKVLHPMGIKNFATQLFKHIPFLSVHLPSIDKILEDWKNYKLSVPTYGAILISEDLQYCLLVQSYFAKTSWGFPKGKVNETEDPEHCATREVFEETGFDITNLIVPRDYIETVLNYQYTRLYIVCNVRLDTMFSPRTRKEIRACNWFPIDCLPNNKNDTISKAKLGQSANSFFLILPFVKRLKKWVHTKRLQSGILDAITNGIGNTSITGLEMSFYNITTKKSTLNNNLTNNHQSRKYSNGCQSSNSSSNNSNNNNGAITISNTSAKILSCTSVSVTGAIPKSPSATYIHGAAANPATANGASISGKKQRPQQARNRKGSNISSSNNNDNSSNNNICNNIAGILKLSDVESSTFAAAASAAANANLKRQRHKSMGDLDNMTLHNNNNSNIPINQSNSCNKKNDKSLPEPQMERQQQQANKAKPNSIHKTHCTNNKQNITNKSDNDKENNACPTEPGLIGGSTVVSSTSNGSIRRKLFHSQSQNDCGHFMGAIEKNESGQQLEQYLKQRKEFLNLFFNESTIAGVTADAKTVESKSGTEDARKQHMRQRAKSQSDKYTNVQHQQEVMFYKNDMKATATAATSSTNSSQFKHLQNQRSMIFMQASSSSSSPSFERDNLKLDTKLLADTNAENQLHLQQKLGGVTSGLGLTDATVPGEKRLLPFSAISTPQQQQSEGAEMRIVKAAALSSNAVFEASAIETHLFQLEKQFQESLQRKGKQSAFSNSEKTLQLTTLPNEQQQQQQQHNSLQHSASSPGLATWKNFSFTKNLISNVFL